MIRVHSLCTTVCVCVDHAQHLAVHLLKGAKIMRATTPSFPQTTIPLPIPTRMKSTWNVRTPICNIVDGCKCSLFAGKEINLKIDFDFLHCDFASLCLLTYSPSSRGMFTWPTSETTGPPWHAAWSILQSRPSVWARVRRRLQALSLYATTMWPSVVHRKIQWPLSVHDSTFPLGRWHPLWGRTGLRPRDLHWQTDPKCEG